MSTNNHGKLSVNYSIYFVSMLELENEVAGDPEKSRTSIELRLHSCKGAVWRDDDLRSPISRCVHETLKAKNYHPDSDQSERNGGSLD